MLGAEDNGSPSPLCFWQPERFLVSSRINNRMTLFHRSHKGWRSLLMVLLLATQGVVAVTPYVEGRGGIGKGAHVEAPRDARHYAHVEAECAFCHVRTISARVAELPPPPFDPSIERTVAVAPVLVVPAIGPVRSNTSRAPPR